MKKDHQIDNGDLNLKSIFYKDN